MVRLLSGPFFPVAGAPLFHLAVSRPRGAISNRRAQRLHQEGPSRACAGLDRWGTLSAAGNGQTA